MGGPRPARESRTLLLVAVIALAVIVGSFLLRPDGSDSSAGSGARDRASDSPSEPLTTETPREKRKKKAANAADTPSGAPGADSFGIPPGLAGSGKIYSLPPHKLTITITAPTAPLGLVAYIIPTSRKHHYGQAKVSGTSWSLTTTVYGNPKYATAFAQAGPRGLPVTCTITVDGKVTERRSTKGSYGAMWCLG